MSERAAAYKSSAENSLNASFSTQKICVRLSSSTNLSLTVVSSSSYSKNSTGKYTISPLFIFEPIPPSEINCNDN